MNTYWLRLLASFILITLLPVGWVVAQLRDSGNDIPFAAADGVMDLRASWSESGKVKLNGMWLLYPGQLLTGAEAASPAEQPVPARVPGVWNGLPAMSKGLGTATYRLRLLLPEHAAGMYGIRATSIRTSARIYVNGEEIGGSGFPGLNRLSTTPSNVPFAAYFRLDRPVADITVQVANYSYASGGIIYPIWFGTQEAIIRSREINLFAYWLTACGFLIPALFLLLFFRLRRREAPLLQLGGFCVCSLLYVLTHGEKAALALLPTLDYDVVLRIQLIISGYIYYFLARYVVQLFPEFGVRTIDRLLLAIASGLTLTGLALPPYLFSRGETLLLACALGSIAYLLYVLLRAVLARRAQTLALTVSIQSVLFMLAVYLLQGFGKLEDQTLLPYAIIIFSGSQAYLIVSRFSVLLAHAQRLSERLLRLDELKDEFMLSTSYEIREPLRGIANLAALQERPEEENGRIRLTMINGIARRLAYLVDDLIDFSLLKNGETAYRRRAVHLQPILRSVIDLYPLQESAAWSRDTLPDGLPPILADERRIGQIIHNLVAYASRHARGANVRFDAYADNGRVTLEMTAPGLHRALQAEREPAEFYPTDVTASESAERLRLTVTRQLIELGDGVWSAEEAADGPSVLRIAWPAAELDASGEPVAPSSRPQPVRSGSAEHNARTEWGRLTSEASGPTSAASAERSERGSLLIVDNDALDAWVMGHLLADAGISIRFAASGAEALALLAGASAFDLAIVDLIMPDMSGLELVRRIREHTMPAELPILLLCEGRRPEEALAGFEAGANDMLIKPYDAAELKARVATLLQLRSSIKNLVRTETAFLQAQIKPHFLFNAINTIMTVCRLDPARAEELLLELSRYLRGSFDFANLAQRVPLSSELELVRSYLAIEAARFGDRLRAEFDIAGEERILVPPLSIQPLVENAVRHGILRKPEGGTVRIRVKPSAAGWQVAVEDDGVGMPGGQPPKPGGAGGVGLTNISRRLRLLYGEALHIDSHPGSGTRVSFIIPEAIQHESDID
ncbi:histidine kinase [Paenibacillus athensensis]|uniref:histidine kinase n=1 Tax=Paenibacillus athensensis TaxID=1967502 RepID=A0A4Y8PWU0_9BACL|nr:histidine kinase [Paenibacillus athensensis]MCD1259433.1 histidine kinase [Paenibacillus athensensis]